MLFLHHRAPHGSVVAQEGLDAVLAAAAFDQNVTVAYLDDGVFQLVHGQDTSSIGIKNFTPAIRALAHYGVGQLLVEQESLSARGLARQDLVDATIETDETAARGPQVPLIRLVTRAELSALMEAQDVVLSF
ncbi:MAG: sulfurtransferase complex subunit TusC [Pseudomonadota bacterium]